MNEVVAMLLGLLTWSVVFVPLSRRRLPGHVATLHQNSVGDRRGFPEF